MDLFDESKLSSSNVKKFREDAEAMMGALAYINIIA
jgi:hypothetical protein